MKKIFRSFGYPEVVWLPKSEHSFLTFICISFIAAMFLSPYPQYAMWAGFLFAAYAAIANDSIQTLGTFIASNQDKKWWILWIFIGGIFIMTMSYSWLTVDENGLTIFSPKLESKEDQEKFEEEVFDNLSIRISKKDDNYIEWNIKDIGIDGSTNYDKDYLNPDYGNCFFLNKEKELCNIYNITVKDELSTYYEYDTVFFKNLTTNQEGVISFDDLVFKLYPDGIIDRDVSHARLSAKGFEKSPRWFHFLQIAAPIFLLILTRLRMPVSTTFILLTSFAVGPAAVGKVLAKSMSGYVLAFILGLVFFTLVARLSKKYFTGKAHFGWTIAQWLTSGTLWAVWLSQDAANIAVYLNRSLDGGSFAAFLSIIVIGLGLLLYFKGGRIQKIVTEKSVVTDVRFATLIDFIYCIILFYFKLHSKVPMSTTWVFIGLLAGRELGMAIMKTGGSSIFRSIKLGVKDMSFALIGLIISIAIAIGVNENLTVEIMMTEMPQQFSKAFVDFFGKLGINL
ncbi:MAG: hypothetical protein CMP60_05315 [Flavobacteriales bacterium]|nr:hypothetical protein [Flavobacteriales bacterium]|tara:strand:- start:2172 stop:3698 length:1527 start_codon:yes stop_codon:yes gene_type:complete